MKRKAVSPAMLLFSGVLFLLSGIFCMTSPNLSERIVFYIAETVLLAFGAAQVLAFLFNRNKRLFVTLLGGAACFVICKLLFSHRDLFYDFFPFLLGLWILTNGVLKAILFFNLRIDGERGQVRTALGAVVSIAAGLWLIIRTSKVDALFWVLTGVYLVLYSFTLFGDCVREIFMLDLDGRYIKRRIKVRPPVLLTAFLPMKWMNSLNEEFNEGRIAGEKDFAKVAAYSNAPEGFSETPLTVFIHMAPQIAFGMGHCDVYFDGKVYSYGTYDSDSVKLGGLFADGVFVEMELEGYIKQCLTKDNEKIVGFSIYVNDEQIKKMHDYIDEFKSGMTRWKCRAENDRSRNYDDPASTFYKSANAKFYKFKSGRHKTYFAVSTNCVFVAENIVAAGGLDVMNMNGIITPGAYMNYLDNQFHRKNSFVVRETILTTNKS